MAKKAKISNNLPSFGRNAKEAIRSTLLEAGREILIKSKTKAPFKDGGLRRDSDVTIVAPLGVWVRYWVEYASVQERGRRNGSREFTNYTTAGTGAHFLENAGKEVDSKMGYLYQKHLRGVKP